MRKYMINVAKQHKNHFGERITNSYSHFFRVEMPGNSKSDIEEVAKEIQARFAFPEFKVEIYESAEQYYTQISI